MCRPACAYASEHMLNKDLTEADKELLAIRRIFSLVDMMKNIKFSNFPNVFKIGVVQQ